LIENCIKNPASKRLVAVRKTTHAAHDAEHVVVERIHANLRRAAARNRVEGNRELERRLVDTREVARAAGLVLLRAQRERVHVDTRARRAELGRAQVWTPVTSRHRMPSSA